MTATDYVPIGRIGLRLLGVYFVIEGVGALIGHGFDLWEQLARVRMFELESVSMYTVGWFISSVFLVAAGVYLLRDGRFAHEAIARPANSVTTEAAADDAEPDSRST